MIGAAAGAFFTYRQLNRPFRGYTESEIFVDIPSGAGSRAIGERLVGAGIIRDELTYRVTLWQSGQARRLKAGEYRFDREMTPLEVLDKIARGDVYLLSLTFREGLTIAEMAQVFETHGFGPAASFVSRCLGRVAGARCRPGSEGPRRLPLSRHLLAAPRQRRRRASSVRWSIASSE